jgi:hypothetical protein
MVRGFRDKMRLGVAGATVSVGNSVGAGGINVVEDVMLVQFLLKKYHMRHFKVAVPGCEFIRDITGYCGEKTRRQLFDFQKTEVWPAFPDLTSWPDGRVDPDEHTMALLCGFYLGQYGKCVNDMSVGSDSDMPSRLFLAIMADPGLVVVGAVPKGQDG